MHPPHGSEHTAAAICTPGHRQARDQVSRSCIHVDSYSDEARQHKREQAVAQHRAAAEEGQCRDVVTRIMTASTTAHRAHVSHWSAVASHIHVCVVGWAHVGGTVELGIRHEGEDPV